MKTPVHIALVDRQSLFRQGMTALLKEYVDLKVVIDVDDGDQLLAELPSRPVDVVLLEIDSQFSDGVETLARLKTAYPSVHVVVLTAVDDTAFVVHLIELGAGAFIPKEKKIGDLVDAIRSLHANNLYHSEDMSRVLMLGLQKRHRPDRLPDTIPLSERELEVMKLLCEQYTNREIAGILKLSPRTIDTYRENIFSKIGARNIAGIVRYAIKHQLIS